MKPTREEEAVIARNNLAEQLAQAAMAEEFAAWCFGRANYGLDRLGGGSSFATGGHFGGGNWQSGFGDEGLALRLPSEGGGRTGTASILKITTTCTVNGMEMTWTSYKLQIEYSDKSKLEFSVEFRAGATDTYMSGLVNAANTILEADPSFFDSFAGQNINIIVDNDANIASIYNQEGHSSSVLTGLHQPTTDGANIYIASQVYGVAGQKHGYLAKNTANFSRFSVWEVIAHEFGHFIDYRAFIGSGSAGCWSDIPSSLVENWAIQRVNGIRGFYGKPLEYLK